MIGHIDADSFFASVLARKHPSLRGKPVLAAGMGGGCVIAASYEAKAKGVRTGMRMSDAIVLCPEAIRMDSDFRETGLASDQIESILQDQCPLVEQYSVDEWFLDLASLVGGVPKDCMLWAESVRLDILRRTHLSVSAGVGPSKLLAKMASEYRKPGGVTVVDFEAGKMQGALSIEEFLRSRPAAAIPGIGGKRTMHADRMNWKTAWDIATANSELLRQCFGRPGVDLKRELLGERLSSVTRDSSPPKSISRARSFSALRDGQVLWAHMLRHLEYTVLKMRRQNLACRGISIWLRDGRYQYDSHHASLTQPLNTEEHLQPYIRRCFGSLYSKTQSYTQAGLSLWKLEPKGSTQLSLFEEPANTMAIEDLQKSLDAIHERFGRDAVTKGSALSVKSGTRQGFELPVMNE
ncbi:MAG: hypothetical protein JWM56_1218 [Candidatus Peribacteria bacterium]|nr:hypothetical protein [Candidatus Peribacteria bacterium]